MPQRARAVAVAAMTIGSPSLGLPAPLARRCMFAAPDERAAVAGQLHRHDHVPAPSMRETKGKQDGWVEGSPGIRFCRSEGKEENRRRVINGRPEL